MGSLIEPGWVNATQNEAWVYELGTYFYRLLAWGAGDDSRIVFQDNHLSLYAIDLPGGSISEIDSGIAD